MSLAALAASTGVVVGLVPSGAGAILQLRPIHRGGVDSAMSALEAERWRLVAAGGNAPRDGLYLVSSANRRLRFVTQAEGANSPAWSPDGSSIAFDQDTDTKDAIDVVSAAGGRPRVLATVPSGTINQLKWAPDGRSIAFGTAHGIDVIKVDGSHRRNVTRLSVHDFSWSPDSAKLVVTASGQIFSVDVARHTKRLLAKGTIGYPSWSPDGRSIVYFRRCIAINGGGDDVVCDLALMNTDGSGKRLLLGGQQAIPNPVLWSRDSRAVYISNSLKHAFVRLIVSTRRLYDIGQIAWNVALARDGQALGFLLTRRVVITTLAGRVLARDPLPAGAFFDDDSLFVG